MAIKEMADQLSRGGDPPPAIRFLKFTNDKEEAEKEAKLKEAAAKIEQAIAKDRALSELIDYKEPTEGDQSTIDLANDTRSLYERLEEQRNKKKEAFDESHKLSNLITTLDEEDVDYLNEITEAKREEELRKRLQVQDALEAKKRLQEQKMLEEEKCLKESLLGGPLAAAGASSAHKSTKQSIRSKLGSLIKVRPKTKTNERQMTRQEEQDNLAEAMATNIAAQTTTKSPTKQRDPSASEESNASAKKRSNSEHEPDDRPDEPERKRKNPTSESPECQCPRNVARTLGILPSLPQQTRDPDVKSSDDTDFSDDDAELNQRLVPRLGCRRRRKHG